MYIDARCCLCNKWKMLCYCFGGNMCLCVYPTSWILNNRYCYVSIAMIIEPFFLIFDVVRFAPLLLRFMQKRL